MSDFPGKFPEIFGVLVRRGIFRENSRNFWGFGAPDDFELNSGNFWGFGAPGDFRFFPGNCAVAVLPGISNCIFVSLRDLC